MRYFLDTEFAEDGRTIDLISIAIVAEDGREFYAVSTEFDPEKCNPWVRENVLPKLPPVGSTGWMNRAEIAESIRSFVRPHLVDSESGRCGSCHQDSAKKVDCDKAEKPEFWGYFSDYDWVVLCQLFGRMIGLPRGWPMWCRDLKQMMQERGIEKDFLGMPPQENQHDALADARWVRDAWKVVDSAGLYIGVVELEERIARSKRRQTEEEAVGHEGEALIFQGCLETAESLLDRAKDERLREFRRRRS